MHVHEMEGNLIIFVEIHGLTFLRKYYANRRSRILGV